MRRTQILDPARLSFTNVPVKEIGDGHIVERNGRNVAELPYQLKVFNQQQIVGRGNRETADF